MSYIQKESLDDFVNRFRWLAQNCSLTKTEQKDQIIEVITASTPIADFQKEQQRNDDTLTLEETLHLGQTYKASCTHIKQFVSIQNTTNEATNTAIKA